MYQTVHVDALIAWCGQNCCYNGIFTSQFASLLTSRLVWMGLKSHSRPPVFSALEFDGDFTRLTLIPVTQVAQMFGSGGDYAMTKR